MDKRFEVSDTASARRGLYHGAYLTVIGNVIILAFLTAVSAPGLLVAAVLGHAVLAAALAALLRFEPGLSSLRINIVDALLMAPYFATIWLAYRAPELSFVDHLFAPKLLAFGWAMVVPASYALHMTFILALGIEVLIIWRGEVAQGLVVSATEPWFTVLAFWMAVSLAVLRYRQRLYDHQVVELRTRNEVLTEIAVLFLRVRDLANTPLQKLLLVSEMLARGHPATDETVEGIRGSVEELKRLHAQFQLYEHLVPWQSEHLRVSGDVGAKVERPGDR